ncbi:hypothetical protein ACF0H5_006756 [Mactra antiquata]
MRDNLLFHGMSECSTHEDKTTETCVSKILKFCEDELNIGNAQTNRLELRSVDVFLDDLENHRQGNPDIDSCMKDFTDTVFKISYDHFGKTCSNQYKPKKSKTQWFNAECRRTKSTCFESKRNFKQDPSEHNKTLFLEHRSLYAKTKRKARNIFYSKEKAKLIKTSKT